ncbi:hypothetical protein ANN_18827 [Periplaneta americana]|uniref:Uncharacterized protein n=1 Tax=Periplaneta americana TaxID=6978 RepID=A0ABQ8SPU3_PERAM|nr:hypothetical protein ANN_18827 [Periplaneta americana]
MNDAETDQGKEKELVGSLAEKKLPTEGCTGRNGEQEKSSGRRQLLSFDPSAWGLGEGLTTHHYKKELVTKPQYSPQNGADSLAQPQQCNYITGVLYGCETWTLTLKEKQRLRVYEKKMLRKIFEAKRDEVTGEWRKLHNTELHALYSSANIVGNIKSRHLRCTRHAAHIGEFRNPYRVFVVRPEGKRSLGRPRYRWEDNIKMDLREVGYDARD